MNIKPFVVPALVLVCLGGAQAETLPSKIFPPHFLGVKDKVPNEALANPGNEIRGKDGKISEIQETTDPPESGVMRHLAFPDLFVDIKNTKKKEKRIQNFYWHQSGGLDYCHIRDAEGNHWYGWNSGEGFHWVLWRGRRFWWRDPFAGHWLYYYQGYWWRADSQKDRTIQVIVKGEYYLCGAEGKILKDMGQDGEGDIVSAPGVYQGDVRSSGRGGGSHGGHKGHSTDKGPSSKESTAAPQDNH